MQCCSLWCNTFRHQFTSTLLQLYSFTKLHKERFKYIHLQYMTNFINLHLAQHFLSSSPKQRWFVMNIYRAAKRKKIHRHHRQIWSPTETVLVIRETNFFICFIKKQLFSSLGDIDIKTLWVRRGVGKGTSGVMQCRQVLQWKFVVFLPCLRQIIVLDCGLSSSSSHV